MTQPYDPDAINKQIFGNGTDATPNMAPRPAQAKRETQPLSQDDAIILKDQKEEFDRSPVPPAIYDVVIEKAEYGLTGPRAQKPNSPKINFTFNIKGPSQVGRYVWLNLPTRSGDFGGIMLKKLLTRAQKSDGKGEYKSLIDFVDTEKPFDEKDFCDRGIAIGAEARINVRYGRPYTKEDGTTVTPNRVSDIMYPSGGSSKFM